MYLDSTLLDSDSHQKHIYLTLITCDAETNTTNRGPKRTEIGHENGVNMGLCDAIYSLNWFMVKMETSSKNQAVRNIESSMADKKREISWIKLLLIKLGLRSGA